MAPAGSLPGLRIGTKPAPSRSATAAPRMNPRLSMPTTTSMPWPWYGRRERVDRGAEARRLAQQRGDVVEEDAGLREIGDVSNVRFEIHACRLRRCGLLALTENP